PPCGPVYICLDAALQESRIGALPPLPSAARFRPPRAAAPDPAAAAEAATLLNAAERPLILVGRVGRGEAEWQSRVKLAEALGAALREAVGTRPTCLIRGPLAWAGNTWDVAHPLDALGGDGGGGIGGGPGMAVGAALALRGSGRLPVAVLGDGDFLMGATALWTAVHYRIPLLVIVSNNNSFFNDELHQDRMARQRSRPVANRWIGQRIADPEPDLATLARGQGAEGFGPIRRPEELLRALRAGIDCVEGGGGAVVDVRV